MELQLRIRVVPWVRKRKRLELDDATSPIPARGCLKLSGWMADPLLSDRVWGRDLLTRRLWMISVNPKSSVLKAFRTSRSTVGGTLRSDLTEIESHQACLPGITVRISIWTLDFCPNTVPRLRIGWTTMISPKRHAFYASRCTTFFSACLYK